MQAGAAKLFVEFGIGPQEINQLIDSIWDSSVAENLTEFDRYLQNLLVGRLRQNKIRELLDARADHVARQIRPYLIGESLLDVGSGDGMVAWNIRDCFQRHLLVDVVDYQDQRVKLPFAHYEDRESLPTLSPSDCAILINVMHHSAAGRQPVLSYVK